MDRIQDCGSCDPGSIPGGSAGSVLSFKFQVTSFRFVTENQNLKFDKTESIIYHCDGKSKPLWLIVHFKTE